MQYSVIVRRVVIYMLLHIDFIRFVAHCYMNIVQSMWEQNSETIYFCLAHKVTFPIHCECVKNKDESRKNLILCAFASLSLSLYLQLLPSHTHSPSFNPLINNN